MSHRWKPPKQTSTIPNMLCRHIQTRGDTYKHVGHIQTRRPTQTYRHRHPQIVRKGPHHALHTLTHVGNILYTGTYYLHRQSCQKERYLPRSYLPPPSLSLDTHTLLLPFQVRQQERLNLPLPSPSLDPHPSHLTHTP